MWREEHQNGYPHEYTGLSVCGCTAFAQVAQPKRKRHRGWGVLVTVVGPCHPNGPETLHMGPFDTEVDALAAVESIPVVAWV